MTALILATVLLAAIAGLLAYIAIGSLTATLIAILAITITVCVTIAAIKLSESINNKKHKQ